MEWARRKDRNGYFFDMPAGRTRWFKSVLYQKAERLSPLYYVRPIARR
jgi:hypothetical protein